MGKATKAPKKGTNKDAITVDMAGVATTTAIITTTIKEGVAGAGWLQR